MKAWNYKLRTFRTWQAMIARCHFPASTGYDRYGQKGIKVCPEWRKFETFVADMGYRPVGTTLGRKNHYKGYFPGNCRWETGFQQSRNRITTKYLEHAGKRLSLAEWAELRCMRSVTLLGRLRAGWSVDEALLTPVRTWKHR